MSGTSLISSLPVIMDDNVNSIVNSGDSVHSMMSSTSSVGHGGLKGGIHRPPGLGGVSMPSPIGKQGQSYTSTGSTAQNLTLTPTSSLDGGDVSYVRQSSPFHGDGPSLSSDHTGFGSFDGDSGGHDGLLGLQALPRERSQSSPGPTIPYSSSPPVRTGHLIGAFDDGRSMKPRTVTREAGRSQSVASRPPLSGTTGMSPQITEGKSYYPGSTKSSGEVSPSPPGVISRPGIPPYDPGIDFRSRSVGSENSQPVIDHLTYQFGQMGNYGGFAGDSYPYERHQRASSLPGPMRLDVGQQELYRGDFLGQYSGARRGNEYGGASPTSVYNHGEFPDPRFMSHDPQYAHDQMGRMHVTAQRRSSLQNTLGPNSDMFGARNLHRRESLDFVPGHSRYPDGSVTMSQDTRLYMNEEVYRNDRFQQYSAGHHRIPSSDVSSNLSSSPASMTGSTRGLYGYDVQGARGRYGPAQSEDDLSHPLAGEHIDVPNSDRNYPTIVGMQGRGRHEPPLPHYGGAASARVVAGTGAPIQMPRILFNIKFKRTQRAFVLGPRLTRDLKMGTYVKVEADRGEDLGIVVGKVPPDQPVSNRSGFRGDGSAPVGANTVGSNDMKRITRLATQEEVALLKMKREEEDELLMICRTKVQQRGLNMNVVDAEYQFDRHKLTFFFEAEGRVDFRELVRDLFSMYKTRIWMQQLDKGTGATCPAAPEEPESDEIDYGTPIIAPESEYSEFPGGPSTQNASG